MNSVEEIRTGKQLVAIVVSKSHNPASTEFVTTPDLNLQVGLIRYPVGGQVQPHVHLPLERHIQGTNEVVIVRSGKVEALFYDDDRELVETRTLEEGDLVLLVAGGHSFRMLEDSLLMEVKQGPYTGLEEKERFEP